MFNKVLKALNFSQADEPMMLRVPRSNENQGGLLLGDTGTGKTVTLHQIVYQARAAGRREPGFCYDPAGEFSQVHFREKTDAILNPLDARFPNWQIHWEVNSPADADLVAESFFNTQELTGEESFFQESSKAIFKLLLLKKISNQKMVEVLTDPKAIDDLVKGTELTMQIPATAGPQRGAVLGTLTKVADVIRQLPLRSKNHVDLCLTDWAKKKGQSWLFLTSTLESRALLRPIQAAMLNILMMRLMSAPAETGIVEPFWFIADELHSLKKLSAFPTFIYESRKFGAKYMVGTQNKQQYIKNYGQEALALMASPALKIFLRCNESETAQWISDNIGNEERNMPFNSVSIDGSNAGKTSTSYGNRTEKRAVVSKEQIMHLPNLHGYWCYEGKVVPFVLQTTDWEKKYPAFIKRTDRNPPEKATLDESESSDKPASDSDIDLDF